tara:strand:+ start:105 stop:308 length:204 start_codon:yes stop_codon:yes gene_type:complete
MNIEVYFEREQTSKKIEFSGITVDDLLKQLEVNPETVIVTKNKEVVTEDEPLSNNDKLELLNVISGG